VKGGGGIMVYYRLYLVDAASGRFVGFEEIDAPDDVEAVHMAENYVGSQGLELWCGKRKVKSFQPRQKLAGG
jgi:hypothetical protein